MCCLLCFFLLQVLFCGTQFPTAHEFTAQLLKPHPNIIVSHSKKNPFGNPGMLYKGILDEVKRTRDYVSVPVPVSLYGEGGSALVTIADGAGVTFRESSEIIEP